MFKFISLSLLLLSSAYADYNYSLVDNADAKMKTRVNFWKKVYTEITSQQAFIHDKEDISIIYAKIDIPHTSPRQKGRYTNKEVKKIKNALYSIVQKQGKDLNELEEELYAKVKDKSFDEIKTSARRLRSQYGLKDNYYIGLKRSYLYLDYIKSVLKEMNVPAELRFLPHVESSFNYQAYSKVGAAGIWQFMRGTARNYRLKINYVIDERRDVFKATVAAAKLLRHNYENIKAWPLAITAYNHGLRSMQRAVQRVGTTEISEIIDKYDGRRFGFASKNFYATFLATVEISKDPSKYFPEFELPKPFSFSSLKLTKPLRINELAEIFNISKADIKAYNPSIRAVAFNSIIALPRDFEFRFPKVASEEIASYSQKMNEHKSSSRELKYAGTHTINRGDNLYLISKLYNVSMHDLIVFNKLSNPSKIFTGMKLKIPSSSDISKLSEKVAVATKPEIKEEIVAVTKTNIEKIKDEPQIAQMEKPSEKEKESIFSMLNPFKKKEPIVAVNTEQDEEDIKAEDASKFVSLDSYELNLELHSSNIYILTIESDETLGHYAEWAGIKTQNIRNLNNLSYKSSIFIGQKLKIALAETNRDEFISKRAEFHLSIQEDFYQSFRVGSTKEYTVRRGDNLLSILTQNEIPFWLFRQVQKQKVRYNQSLNVGDKFLLPEISEIEKN